MKKRFKVLTKCRNTTTEEKAALLGYVNMIIFMCGRYSVFQIQTLFFWISPAIDHKQIIVLFDNTSTPMGYVTWAHLASDTEQRLLTDQNFLLHPSEWNEGGRTWIIDLCFPCGGIKEALKALERTLQSRGIDQVSWARRGSDYSVRKTGSRKILTRLSEI